MGGCRFFGGNRSRGCLHKTHTHKYSSEDDVVTMRNRQRERDIQNCDQMKCVFGHFCECVCFILFIGSEFYTIFVLFSCCVCVFVRVSSGGGISSMGCSFLLFYKNIGITVYMHLYIRNL